MSELFEINSVGQLVEAMGFPKPQHPLIAAVDFKDMKPNDSWVDVRIQMNLYVIALKNNQHCRMRYGREYYDFQEGSMMFIGPGQVITPEYEPGETQTEGWGLYFHPDLIRRSILATKIKDYNFFSYDAREALHVSEKEKVILDGLVQNITTEYSGNIDTHSKDLIVSNLETLLNYANRFYGRQFITRTNVNKDIITRFQEFLEGCFEADRLKVQGMPTVKYCAEQMGYSPNYFSDMLKQETGKNTQEHIYFHLIERAKDLLLQSDDNISEIAFQLGFEYPGHFSRLFKKKTGLSPAEFRN